MVLRCSHSHSSGWDYRLPDPITLQQTACPCTTPCLFLPTHQNIAPWSREAGIYVDPRAIVCTGAKRQLHSDVFFTSAVWPPRCPGAAGPGKDPRVPICEHRALHFAGAWVGAPFSSHLGLRHGPQTLSRSLGTQSELTCSHLVPMVVYPGPEGEDLGT